MIRTLLGFAVIVVTTAPLDARPQKKDDQPTDEVMGRSLKDWRKDLATNDPSRRDEALRAILQFGPEKAYEAAPDIIAMLKRSVATDLGVRDRGLRTLSTILERKTNPDPVHLREALALHRLHLKDPQAILRVHALQSLPSLGPVAREALDDVLRLVRDPAGWEVRSAAIVAATEITCDEHAKTARFVAEALSDNASHVRLTALQALTRLGVSCNPQDRSAVLDKLKSAATREPDKVVKIHILKTIVVYDANLAAASVAPIVKMMKDPEVRVRKEAISALGALGPNVKAMVLKAIVEAIQDPDMETAEAAIRALAPLGAVEALPHLEKIADDTKRSARLRDAADDAIYLLRMK